jgi:hypothetical protein
MSPSEVDELLYAEPFQPLRVTLASGDQIVIRREHRAFTQGLCIVLAGDDSTGARFAGGPRLVSIPNIVLVEPVGDRPEVRRRRR